MNRSTEITRAALDVADRQCGVVSRRQLLTCGISATTIGNRVAMGLLFPVFAGVYLVGRPQLTPGAVLQAALLAAGDGAVLGMRSAAALWGFFEHRSPIEVLRVYGGVNQQGLLRVEGEGWRPYLVVRQTRPFDPDVVVIKEALPVTTPEYTLRDQAAFLTESRFRRAFNEADRLHLLDDARLVRLASRTQGRKGGGVFREMVQRRIPDIELAASTLEVLVLELVRNGLVPRPQVNSPVDGYRPDFSWPGEKVIVEADGYEAHRGREAFESDTLRSNRLRAAGWTVLRFTWRQVTEQPGEVAEMIRRTLAEGGARRK